MSLRDTSPIKSSYGNEAKDWGQLEDEGLDIAESVLSNAHAPYSGTKVGAALYTEYGFYTGVNIEVGGRMGSVHAEMLAVYKAVADGAEEMPFICVATNDDGAHIPCSMCQHVLAEFTGDMTLVAGNEYNKRVARLSDELGQAWMPGDNR